MRTSRLSRWQLVVLAIAGAVLQGAFAVSVTTPVDVRVGELILLGTCHCKKAPCRCLP